MRAFQRRIHSIILVQLQRERVVNENAVLADVTQVPESPLALDRFKHFVHNSRRDGWATTYFNFTAKDIVEGVKDEMQNKLLSI